MNLVRVMNLGRRLSLSGAIFYFDVEFRQGKKSVTIPTYFDSGAKNVHATIPKKYADEIGLEPTGTATMRATSGTKEVSIGKVDFISIPNTKCTLANGKVIIIGDKEPASLGQPFLAALGSTIKYVGDKILFGCSQVASPIGIYPQFSFDLTKGTKRETVTAILDTGFTGGVSVGSELAKKLGLEKSSEVDVTDASGRKWKAGISVFDRVAFTGHPKCAVEGLEAYIYPADIDKPILVGEKFLKGMAGGAYLGYDENGAWAACEAEGEKIKAAKSVYLNIVSPESLPAGAPPTLLAVESAPGTWIPWVLGGTAAVGLAALFFMKRK